MEKSSEDRIREIVREESGYSIGDALHYYFRSSAFALSLCFGVFVLALHSGSENSEYYIAFAGTISIFIILLG